VRYPRAMCTFRNKTDSKVGQTTVHLFQDKTLQGKYIGNAYFGIKVKSNWQTRIENYWTIPYLDGLHGIQPYYTVTCLPSLAVSRYCICINRFVPALSNDRWLTSYAQCLKIGMSFHKNTPLNCLNVKMPGGMNRKVLIFLVSLLKLHCKRNHINNILEPY
jgi:hypothetical protein